MPDEYGELERAVDEHLERIRARLDAATVRDAPERDDHLDRVLLVIARARVRAAVRRGASVAQALQLLGGEE